VTDRPKKNATADDRVDAVFRALNSRPRRAILRLLAEAETAGGGACCDGDMLCACEFSDRLGLSAPTVSHHMKGLIEAGLVASEKRGLWVHYRLVPGAFAEMLEELRPFLGAADRGGSCACGSSAGE